MFWLCNEKLRVYEDLFIAREGRRPNELTRRVTGARAVDVETATEMCRNFQRGGCRFGQNCRYIHDTKTKPQSDGRLECRRCGSSEHRSSECPDVECFNCHHLGHISSNCPNSAPTNQVHTATVRIPGTDPEVPVASPTVDSTNPQIIVLL